MRTIVFTAAAALAASCATAKDATTQQAQTTPPPPCQSEIYHAIDFWLGEWEVFGPKDAKAGDNSITRQEYGCLLLEKWVNTGGQTGQSYNFYDLTTDKWRQIWVSAGAVIDYSGGLNENGAMVLEGTIGYPNGLKAPFKGTWTLNEDGTVTQYFQQYNAKTEEWDDWFTGTYKKKEETAAE